MEFLNIQHITCSLRDTIELDTDLYYLRLLLLSTRVEETSLQLVLPENLPFLLEGEREEEEEKGEG